MLNLFSYTGSLSVAAGVAGGHVTSVDISQKYLEWGAENFKANGISADSFINVCESVPRFLEDTREEFDVIVLDPPTFSNTKKKNINLSVQRDHVNWIRMCLKRMTKDGVLWFSNNMSGFKMEFKEPEAQVKDMTEWSIPIEMRPKKPHKLWKITK